MEQKILFDLKDITQQLSPEQIKEMEHIVYLAKETKELQEAQIGEYGRKIIICPSGKMMFKPEEKKVCPECGNSS